jgi:hypothetical protein
LSTSKLLRIFYTTFVPQNAIFPLKTYSAQQQAKLTISHLQSKQQTLAPTTLSTNTGTNNGNNTTILYQTMTKQQQQRSGGKQPKPQQSGHKSNKSKSAGFLPFTATTDLSPNTSSVEQQFADTLPTTKLALPNPSSTRGQQEDALMSDSHHAMASATGEEATATATSTSAVSRATATASSSNAPVATATVATSSAPPRVKLTDAGKKAWSQAARFPQGSGSRPQGSDKVTTFDTLVAESRKKLASAKRTNILFCDFNFSVVNEPDCRDSTPTARKNLLGIIEAGLAADPSLVVMVYDTKEDVDPFVGALTGDKLNNASFPHSFNQMQKYFSKNLQFKFDEEYPIYSSIKIAFNGNKDEIITNMAGFARSIRGYFEVAPIQSGKVVQALWMPGTHRHINVQDLQRELTFQMDVLNRSREDRENRRPSPPPIALKWKLVWDGIPKSQRPAGWKPIYAIHIFCLIEDVKEVKHMTKTILLSHVNKGWGRYNFKIRVADCLERGMDSYEKDACASSRAWHNCIVSCMSHYDCYDILNPKLVAAAAPRIRNPKTGDLEPFTLRRWLFSKHPPGNPRGARFLSVEPDHNHSKFVITFCRAHEDFCLPLARGLPIHVMKEFGEQPGKEGEAAGDAILRLLSETGQERYTNEDWDEENQRVVSGREREMQEMNNELEIEWDFLEPPPSDEEGNKLSASADAPKKRPLPRDLRDNFDDRSFFTTNSDLTIKHHLRAVDLSDAPDQAAESLQRQLGEQELAAAEVRAKEEEAARLAEEQLRENLRLAAEAEAAALRAKREAEKALRLQRMDRLRQSSQVVPPSNNTINSSDSSSNNTNKYSNIPQDGHDMDIQSQEGFNAQAHSHDDRRRVSIDQRVFDPNGGTGDESMRLDESMEVEHGSGALPRSSTDAWGTGAGSVT